MVERRIDNEKKVGSITDEFNEIVSNQPAFDEQFLFDKNLSNNKDSENLMKELKNKKNSDEDNSDDSDNNSDSDGTPNFRDKDKELKELIKSDLSLESQDVINMNEDEFNSIIEQLKKRGLSKDKGIQLQNLRSISKSRGNISR